MITAVDSSILIDVLEGDPEFGQLSAAALIRACREGALVACEVVWAEVATAYPQAQDLAADLSLMGLRYDPLEQATALQAAKAWAQFRSAGGSRRRIAADFLIGAHAACQADRLLTRDAGFHRRYFEHLQVSVP